MPTVLDAAQEHRLSGGLSPSLAALPSTTRPSATSTWLRGSTRSSAASAHPAVAASTSVRNCIGAVGADARQQRDVTKSRTPVGVVARAPALRM